MPYAHRRSAHRGLSATVRGCPAGIGVHRVAGKDFARRSHIPPTTMASSRAPRQRINRITMQEACGLLRRPSRIRHVSSRARSTRSSTRQSWRLGFANRKDMCMDEDLADLDRNALVAEVKRLRAGIRAHRDSAGHELCWHDPRLWGLLPEKSDPLPHVPAWPQFLRGCLAYRESLDQQIPHGPRTEEEFDDRHRSRLSVLPQWPVVRTDATL